MITDIELQRLADNRHGKPVRQCDDGRQPADHVVCPVGGLYLDAYGEAVDWFLRRDLLAWAALMSLHQQSLRQPHSHDWLNVEIVIEADDRAFPAGCSSHRPP